MIRKRVALFGGSFNPIHNGHIALAKQIISDKLADEVWLLISPQNPLKEESGLMDENIRLDLARKALCNETSIIASDFEFHLPRPSFSWSTLNALSQEYPENDFVLVIGADNWLIFNKWAHYEDIILKYPIIIYPRKGCYIESSKLPKTIHLMDSPLYPFSSTEIRKACETIKKMLPKEIWGDFLNKQCF